MSREVPEGWKLGKVGQFVEEFKVLHDAGDLPPLSVTKSRGIVFQAEKFNKRIANLSSKNYKVVRRGDYSYDPMSLYYGAIGRLKVCDAGIVSPAYITFRLKGSIERRFFDLYVTTSEFLTEVNKVTTGGNQDGKRKKTDWSSFCSLPISIPPLHEQRRIAEILSSVDEAIAATRTVIEQTRKVKQGVLERLLAKGIGHTHFKQTEIGEIPEGWECRRIADVASVKGGKRMPSGRPFADYKTDHPYIRVSDFAEGSIDRAKLVYVLPEDQKVIARYTISSRDVYISIAGTIGVSGMVPPDLDGAQLTENAAKISVQSGSQLMPEFLSLLISAPIVQKQIAAAKGVGGGVPKLALFRIEGLTIPIPPQEEQAEIVKNVSSFDNAVVSANSALSALLSTKSALMSDLLTGRKRVTDAMPIAAE